MKLTPSVGEKGSPGVVGDTTPSGPFVRKNLIQIYFLLYYDTRGNVQAASDEDVDEHHQGEQGHINGLGELIYLLVGQFCHGAVKLHDGF